MWELLNYLDTCLVLIINDALDQKEKNSEGAWQYFPLDLSLVLGIIADIWLSYVSEI
jgi:hypothetical protein